MSLFLLWFLCLTATGQLPEATGIMNHMRELTLTGSLGATISLTIKEKNGTARNRILQMMTKSYPDGTEKRTIRFTEPADVSGTAMLITDNKEKADEMWIYLPALKKTRRIVSSEKGKSFMSSEFSNADFSSPTLSDFTNSHQQGSGENKTWILASVPVNDEKKSEYGYSKKVSYINSDNWQLKKMEFYNFDNQLYKVIEIKAVEPGENGSYIIRDMVATNLVNGRSSEIRFSSIRMNQKIDEQTFSLQNLGK